MSILHRPVSAFDGLCEMEVVPGLAVRLQHFLHVSEVSVDDRTGVGNCEQPVDKRFRVRSGGGRRIYAE